MYTRSVVVRSRGSLGYEPNGVYYYTYVCLTFTWYSQLAFDSISNQMRLYFRQAGLSTKVGTTLPLDHPKTICVATRLFLCVCFKCSSASLGPSRALMPPYQGFVAWPPYRTGCMAWSSRVCRRAVITASLRRCVSASLHCGVVVTYRVLVEG